VARQDSIFDFPLVRYVRNVEESKKLNSLNGPAVFIAAAGMAESGRILHHLANHIGDHRNMVLFVGFQAAHTLGRRIQEGQNPIKIFGEMLPARAEVATITGYSAHADRAELRAWVRKMGGPIRRAFVVHGEPGPALAMAQMLHEEGVQDVVVPKHGETFPL
jgi:metallo-beta-lactamase family protein